MTRRSRHLGHATRVLSLGLVLAVLATACGKATTGSKAGPGQTDGVTPTEIRVGALIAETGPLGSVYDGLTQGVRAYFDMVNAQGGVNGRLLRLAKTRDDATSTTRSTSQARALVEQDHVFAVFASSPVFGGGNYLAANSIPTFGTNFNDEWKLGPSLFGHNGSFNDPSNPGPFLSWLAGKAGAKVGATIAYTVASSADCSNNFVAGFKKFGLRVGLQDSSLPFGATDVSADIQRMKENHVSFVATCMDATGNTLVYKALKEANLNSVSMYWPNGYDQTTLKNYADLMEGVYFGLLEVPLEDASHSPEMQTFLAQMAKSFPTATAGEEALFGWVVADLFTTGLRKIGHDVTRKRLVDALNTVTHWTGHGLIPAVDWTRQHSGDGLTDCTAVVQVQHGKFVPVFGTSASPFVCFRAPHAATTDTIPPQPYSDTGNA